MLLTLLLQKLWHKSILFMYYHAEQYHRHTAHMASPSSLVQQQSSFSFNVILPSVWVSTAGFVEACFHRICIFVVPGYQRKCCTMSAFRPFLTSEHKRQGPERDEELAIWRLIISGLTEIGHEAQPAVDTRICEDTHTYTLFFPVGGLQAGFLLFLSEQENTNTDSFSTENREKVWLKDTVPILFLKHTFIVIFFFMAPSAW